MLGVHSLQLEQQASMSHSSNTFKKPTNDEDYVSGDHERDDGTAKETDKRRTSCPSPRWSWNPLLQCMESYIDWYIDYHKWASLQFSQTQMNNLKKIEKNCCLCLLSVWSLKTKKSCPKLIKMRVNETMKLLMDWYTIMPMSFAQILNRGSENVSKACWNWKTPPLCKSMINCSEILKEQTQILAMVRAHFKSTRTYVNEDLRRNC